MPSWDSCSAGTQAPSLAVLPFSVGSIISMVYTILPDPLITFTYRKKEGGEEKRACPL